MIILVLRTCFDANYDQWNELQLKLITYNDQLNQFILIQSMKLILAQLSQFSVTFSREITRKNLEKKLKITLNNQLEVNMCDNGILASTSRVQMISLIKYKSESEKLRKI